MIERDQMHQTMDIASKVHGELKTSISDLKEVTFNYDYINSRLLIKAMNRTKLCANVSTTLKLLSSLLKNGVVTNIPIYWK